MQARQHCSGCVHLFCRFTATRCHGILIAMIFTTNQSRLAPRLINALYTEALLLADEAHAYFDATGAAERDALPPILRVTYSCEAMRITMRLTHIVTWLLARRAIDSSGQLGAAAYNQVPRLGLAEESDAAAHAVLPAGVRALIVASRELYQRTARLEAEIENEEVAPCPARHLLRRIERAF